MSGQPNSVMAALRSQCGTFLLLLLSADLAFVFVHFTRDVMPPGAFDLYSLETDRGYAEIFQYVKLWWIVLLLAALWWRRRIAVYLAWMLLFVYLLGDDALRFHEHGGRELAKLWQFEAALGFRSQDFGELAVSGIAALVVLLALAGLYRRSAPEGKAASRNLALYVGVLVFFGVVIDMLHIVVVGDFAQALFGALEDGGEMLAVSLICWYVLQLLERGDRQPGSLRQLARSAWTAIRT